MEVDIRADDLTVVEELGRGAYGVVEKVKSISDIALLLICFLFLPLLAW